ncbi:hypothetical protein KCP77_08575 [Salmonella enterica subsp. enterica]|nr:hypothetical protein KCP77_08575 [Salmonella enterica subsp. enterica]
MVIRHNWHELRLLMCGTMWALLRTTKRGARPTAYYYVATEIDEYYANFRVSNVNLLELLSGCKCVLLCVAR